MIRILYRDPSGDIRDGEPDQLPEILRRCQKNPSSMVWVDLHDAEGEAKRNDGRKISTDPEIARVLRDVFKFHPLAVDDALEESSTPKLDDWGDYLFIALHAADYDRTDDSLHTHELDLFLGRDFVVTHHFDPLPALERVWKNVRRDERHTRRGPDYVVYELCDAMASDYMPALENMSDELDDLENAIFEGKRVDGQPPSAHIFKIKRQVLGLRRILGPQREVMNKLARDSHPALDAKEQVYFRDVYDHFVRLADLTESLRDITAGALDTYLSVTANKTNDVMKALTLVTVLFAPLSFVTGFFGMNFFGGSYEVPLGLPPWLLFVIMLLIVVGVPLALLAYFKNKGWWNS